jgi:hypothetical protein
LPHLSYTLPERPSTQLRYHAFRMFLNALFSAIVLVAKLLPSGHPTGVYVEGRIDTIREPLTNSVRRPGYQLGKWLVVALLFGVWLVFNATVDALNVNPLSYVLGAE